MATFTNQTTNLSNLSTALGSLCRGLQAPNNDNQSQDFQQAAREQAEEFLDTIIERVDLVDEALMKSTEHLLPPLTGRGEPSRMTATELSQLLSSLHAANAQKIQQLEHFLAKGSSSSPQSASGPDEQQQQQQLELGDSQEKNQAPHHWFLGLPLDKVVETDNETDRYSCSSASVMKSPSVSNNTPSRPPFTPGTPCTPSIAELKLSASTAKILTKEIMDDNSPAPSISKDLEVSFQQDGNYWSRYMGDANQSIEYRNTSALESAPAKIEVEKEAHPGTSTRNPFVIDNESLDDDDDDEEEEDEESNAEESTICSTVVAEGRKPRQKYHQRPIPEEEVDDYTLGESTIGSARPTTGIGDDDVTTLCPTLVANQNEPENQQQVRNERLGASKFSAYQHDISQVELENDLSQSHTFLTMDGTMYFNDPSEVMSQQSSRYANDAASLGEETPVLDRYRIDPDDSSVGFKVVPNERGSSRRKARANKETNSYLSSSINSTFDTQQIFPKNVKFHDRSVQESDEVEERQVYRRTPYPKAAVGRVSSSSRGEEDQTNASFHTGTSYQAEGDFDSRIIRFDVSTPTNQGASKTFRKTPIPSKKWNNGADDDDSVEIEEKSKVHFVSQSPYKYLTTPAKQQHKTFRSTPHPKKGDMSSRTMQNLRFDIGSTAAPESTTPTKATAAINRKMTPYAKSSDDTSSQSSSVRFSNKVRFEIETPVKSTHQTYRKTPFVRKTVADDTSDSLDPNDRVRFDLDLKDQSFSSVTCRSTSAKKKYRKTPYHQKPKGGLSQVDENVAENNAFDLHERIKPKAASSSNPQRRSPLVDLSPPIGNRSSTPQHIQIMNHEMVTSPMSLSSTLTGITGLTYAENNRELFPAKDISAIANASTPASRLRGISEPVKKATEFATPRKSTSALIPQVTESELAQASPVVKMQANLDEVNKAISALNGAAFLKQTAGKNEDTAVLFSDAEAYKILRNCGFKRRRCKGMLMSLCHFRRLVMRDSMEANNMYDDDAGQHFFEVVSYRPTSQ